MAIFGVGVKERVSCLTYFGGVSWMEDRSEGQVEAGLGIGVGRVEVGDGGVEEFCERKVRFADAMDDAAGELVGSIAVEVSVVCDGGGLTGK